MNLANPQKTYDSLLWLSEMGVETCEELRPQKAALWQSAGAGSDGYIAQRTSPPGGGSRRGAELGHSTVTNQPPPLPSPSEGGLHALTRSAPTSITAAIAEARALADAAADLPALEAAVRGFTGCALKKTATNTVFAQGVAESRLMFIGEAPGADEDRQGVPFCGVSGQLLDKMLSFIGLRRAENFYITNCLFWRPPGNRQPTKEELEICRPFVEKHIALIDPKILVLVGGTATSSMLKDTRGITRLRGQIFRYKNDYMARDVPVHVLYHPSYLLRQPLAKKQAWADLLALRGALHSFSD